MRRANCKGILRGTVLMLAVILFWSGCQRTVPEENANESMREKGPRPEDQWIGDLSRSLTVLEKQREQINFLLENARPAFELGELETILQEELAPYFDGTRTAQETAGILNSRVQLYLDERK